MYRLFKQNDDVSAYVTEFVADTEADIKDLPSNVYPGSLCLIKCLSRQSLFNNFNFWCICFKRSKKMSKTIIRREMNGFNYLCFM